MGYSKTHYHTLPVLVLAGNLGGASGKLRSLGNDGGELGKLHVGIASVNNVCGINSGSGNGGGESGKLGK